MVDVLIRNVDEDFYAELKSDAAKRRVTLAEEIKYLYVKAKFAGGRGVDLLKVPPSKINTEEIKTASKNADKFIEEGIWNDFVRHKRSSRTVSGK